MDDIQLNEEENIKRQQEINVWFDNLPAEAAGLLKKLQDKVAQIETFDLLSNISYYNHLHDAKAYTDFRGDKMYVVSELIALIALKRNYVNSSNVDMAEGLTIIKEVQELGNRYFTIMAMLQMKQNHPVDDHTIADIAFRTMRDETIIRNPSIPEHHLILSEELFGSLDVEIKMKFGFSIRESISIREAIVRLINDRINKARREAEQRSTGLSMEVYRYRSTKIVPENSSLLKENLDELNKLSRKQIKDACYNYSMNDMLFQLGDVYCFTAKDLSDFTGYDLTIIESFIKQFACCFPSVSENDLLFGPTHILKKKPLVEHKERILIPSIPLLTWCVEPVLEEYFKSTRKLQNKFIKIKHDFLLRKGKEFLANIFVDTQIHTNLYYHYSSEPQKRFETDGIFLYERILFIIEAKAHRISEPAKQGKLLRTEQHLKEIVKDSYDQGLRTLNYVKSTIAAEFLTETKKKVIFNRKDFEEVILFSLVLEPIGNVTPLIRATNELGYFRQGIFPWIISLYDLLIISDHFEMPVLLPHYIKRRKEFLERKMMNVFEEIDLLGYYLFNRLYIEGMYHDAELNAVNRVYLDNETDAINNYYMQKYRLNNPDAPKLGIKMPKVFLKILRSLERLDFSHRQELMQYILDLPPHSMERIKNYIERVKTLFAKDGKNHDCSIQTYIWGRKIGFTYMTDVNKLDLDGNLYFFCNYKLETLNADAWIGIGDIHLSTTEFNIQSAFIARKQ